MIEINTIKRYRKFFSRFFKELCPNCHRIMALTEVEKEEFECGYRYARFCSKCGFRRLISYNELLDVSKEFGLEDLVKSNMMEG